MICSARLLFFTMTLCVCQQVHQRVTNAAELPNPRRDVKLCGGNNYKPKWICDPDNVLTDSDVNRFNKLLEDLRYNTPCACNEAECPSDGAGFTVTIAVKSTLPSWSGEVSAQNYARYLRQYEWTYSACGDDVVVVFVNMSKEVGMSCGTMVGYELEHMVTEDILRNAQRIFATRDITQSIVFIIRSLKEAFNGEYMRRPPFPVWTVVHMALGSSFVLCCFFSMYICRLLYSQ